MPVEGPYKARPDRLLSFATVFGLASCVMFLVAPVWCLQEKRDPQVTITTPAPPPARDWRPALAIVDENLRALAKRIERPAVYRYLDSRPLKLRASRFADPGDTLTGASSACKLPDDYRRVLPTDYVFAHRDWPCHQLAEICYRGTCVRAIKGTSGPFGCVLADGAEPWASCQDKGKYTWCWTTKPRDDCEYRGHIDLGSAVADAIGVEGLKTVRVRRIAEP